MSKQIFQVFLEPNNITSEEVGNILDRLNSLNSTAEIIKAIGTHAGQNVVGLRIAQRILNVKMQAGKFRDLNQIATVPGIGYRRFTIMISALGNHN